MNRTIRNRKGSTMVFISIVLSSLVMLTMAMIWSARENTVISRIDGITELAGDSIMSEFHREIYEDYGLFILKSDRIRLSSDLQMYMRPPLLSMKNVSVTGSLAHGGKFAIVDPEPIRGQIIAFMRSGGADMITGKEKQDPKSRGSHDLNHGPTIVSLPSRRLPDTDLMDHFKVDRTADLKGVFTQGTEEFLLGSYILGTFNNCTGVADGDHFFHNEVEYILCGKLRDADNLKGTERFLMALRFPSNLAHIYSDTEKNAALSTASEMIAPGPLGLAFKAALACGWAWAESMNDAALLRDGSKVPLIKSSSTWALDLSTLMDYLIDSILDPGRYKKYEEEDQEGQNYDDDIKELHDYEEDPERMLKKDLPVIRPAENKGLDYEQYLRVLLHFKDDPQKVMRILDLIQINVRKDHDGSFLIGEQATGISLEVVANGRTFAHDKIY